MTKTLPRILLAAYLFVLLWLLLFKFSSDPLAVLAHYHTRSLNLIPLAGVSGSDLNDVLYNFMVFVPFGLLLSIVAKATSFKHKLMYIGAVSVAVELLQYLFAIGTTDITDVIMNTLGGLAGLMAYVTASKYITHEILDRCLLIATVVLLVAFTWLRLFIFHVRYQ